MKRILLILIACAALFVLAGANTFAAGPDSTPPTVWGFGMSHSSVAVIGCPDSAAVMVQAKAWDLNGVQRMVIQWKDPKTVGGWESLPMQLKSDGYWRGYIPRRYLTLTYIGTWWVRVAAYDTFNNSTKTGTKALWVHGCPTGL